MRRRIQNGILVLLLAALAAWILSARRADAPTPPAAATGRAQPDPAPASASAAEAQPTGGPADAGSRTDAALPPAASLVVRGLVLLQPSLPIAGAEVWAYRGKAGEGGGALAALSMAQRGRDFDAADLPFVLRGEPIARAVVDADGRFELRTRERHLRLALRHDFYGLAQPEIVHIERETDAAWCVLDPYLGGCVRGRAPGASPADDLTAQLAYEPDPMAAARDPMQFMASIWSSILGEAQPLSNGAFEFRAVLPGCAFAVDVRGSGAGRTRQRPLAPGELREVVVALQPTSALSALVVDEAGAPVAKALVVAQAERQGGLGLPSGEAASARSDEGGKATLQGLPPGATLLTARCNGYVAASLRIELPTAREQQLVLRRGGTCSGIVVDRDGKPVADARVAPVEAMSAPVIGDLTEGVGLDVLARAAAGGEKTGPDGRFACSGIDGDAPFHVVAMHATLAPGIQKNVRQGADDVRIVLEPTARIRLRAVDDQSGEPLSDFRVELRKRMFLVIERNVRDEDFAARSDGGAELAAVDQGSYTLAVRAEGHAEATQGVTVEAGALLDLGEVRLQRAASVRGRVVDGTGQPIAGALVQQKRGGLADNPAMAMLQTEQARARTDDQGRFALRGLPPGRLQLGATARGYANSASERLALAPGTELDDVEIVLGHGGTIRGRLQVAPGDHAEDFQILAQHQLTQRSAGVTPAADGSFVIPDLEPGAWQVQAMHPRALAAMQQPREEPRPGRRMDVGGMIAAISEHTVSQRCTVRDGEESEVDLDASELGSGVQLSLRILVGEAPLRQGMVEAVQTDDGTVHMGFLEDGDATIAGMKPGAVRIQVRGGLSLVPVGAPLAVDVPERTDRHRATLRLPGGSIGGVVRDAQTHEPLRAALVRLLRNGDGPRSEDLMLGAAVTDERGAFSFEGLEPGRYSVVAADFLGAAPDRQASGRMDVELAAGQQRQGLVLRSQPAAGVTLTVLDALLAPQGGAMALAVDESGQPFGPLGVAVADAHGRAHLGGLPTGRMRIVARAAGLAPGATAVFGVEAGSATQQELRLQRGARVVLDVRGRSGAALRGASVRARCDGGPWFPALLLVEAQRADGAIELGRLGAGVWDFEVDHPSTGVFVITRTVPAGGTVTLVATPGG